MDGNGNCLFSAIKKSLQVCHSRVDGDKDKGQKLPYYPNRYFWCQVVNWIVDNRQKVFKYMGSALRASYGVPDLTASHGGPFSYKTYLTKMLDRQFWGDEIVLWSVLMMWNLKIMVVNSKTLQEYRFCYDVALPHMDVGLVYNSSTHYTAAGKSSIWSLALVSYCWLGSLALLLESYLYSHTQNTCTKHIFDLSSDLVTCTILYIKIGSLAKIFMVACNYSSPERFSKGHDSLPRCLNVRV